MFYNSSLPISEKIYLSDGSLSYVNDLKVGDKVLSIKVTQDGIEDVSDIFTKIIAGDRIVHEYELCEASIYSLPSRTRCAVDSNWAYSRIILTTCLSLWYSAHLVTLLSR